MHYSKMNQPIALLSSPISCHDHLPPACPTPSFRGGQSFPIRPKSVQNSFLKYYQTKLKHSPLKSSKHAAKLSPVLTGQDQKSQFVIPLRDLQQLKLVSEQNYEVRRFRVRRDSAAFEDRQNLLHNLVGRELDDDRNTVQEDIEQAVSKNLTFLETLSEFSE